MTSLLVFGYQPGSELTDEMPSTFSVVQYPDRFDFIGSMKAEHLVSVAFRTDLDPAGAESMLAGLYGEQGWRAMPSPTERGQQGFRSASENKQQHARLCHRDGNGMTIMAREVEQRTFVTLVRTNTPRYSDCNQGPAEDGSQRRGYTDDLMPDLELPADSTTRSSGYGGLIYSSGDDADMHVRVTTDLRPENLLEHFSRQLAAQGWLVDSSWIGELSHGSTWSLTREGLPRTAGNLNILTHSSGDYSVRFSMLAM